jgi:hypothetical protein
MTGSYRRASSRLSDSRFQMQHKGTQYSVVQTIPSKLGHAEARQGSETAMDVKRSQSNSSDALPVECHDLHRQMAEVLALREKVASLELGRKLDGAPKQATHFPGSVA